MRKNSKILASFLAFAVLFTPTILVHAKEESKQTEKLEENSKIFIEFAGNTKFKVYDLTNTKYAEMDKKVVSDNYKNIIKEVKPVDFDGNKFNFPKGKFIMILNEDDSISPIVLKTEAKDYHIIGKSKVKPDPEQPKEMEKTNTPSSIAPFVVASGSLVISLGTLFVVSKRNKTN